LTVYRGTKSLTSGDWYEQFFSEVTWYKQHGGLLHTTLFEGLALVSTWKGSGVMFSLQTKRAIYLTKTPFQLKCNLHDHLMPFLHGSLTLAIVHQ